MTSRFLLAALSLTLSLALGEFVYRAALSSPLEVFAPLRHPGLYADEFLDDDYWKLYHRFGGRWRPPDHPHPLLGWVGAFDRDTIEHIDSRSVRGRRPVLLYGDSFAEGSQGRDTFQGVLNADPEFSRAHYVLNYAVGGYGLDQIYLALRSSLDHHAHPFVIFSLLTHDLDRSMLTVRVGQKPRLRVVDGVLADPAEPIDPDPERWFAEHPPAIRSFLLRRLLYGGLLPAWLSSWIRDERAFEAEKLRLCTAILEATLRELRARDLDFAFLVFQPRLYGPGRVGEDWRDRFLRGFFEANAVPYIWSEDLMQRANREQGLHAEDLLDPNDGHPTQRMVEITAEAIKTTVLGVP